MITTCDKRLYVKVVVHYCKDDLQFKSDYTSIEVFVNEHEEPARSFGDAYHDRGQEKVIGFLLGLEYVYGEENVEVTWEDVADQDG